MCHNNYVTFMSNIITCQYVEFILSNWAVPGRKHAGLKKKCIARKAYKVFRIL